MSAQCSCTWDCDPKITYFELNEGRVDEFQRFAVFDLLVNNADRKAGHCLLDSQDQLWSIDHGLTFNAAFKLRTVMVEFWGQPIPEPVLRDLEALLAMLEPCKGMAAELEGAADRRRKKKEARCSGGSTPFWRTAPCPGSIPIRTYLGRGYDRGLRSCGLVHGYAKLAPSRQCRAVTARRSTWHT